MPCLSTVSVHLMSRCVPAGAGYASAWRGSAANVTSDARFSERKTGLKVRDVETTRLVRVERGWLRRAEPAPQTPGAAK